MLKTAEVHAAQIKSQGSPPPGPGPVSSTEPVSMGEKIGKRGQNNRWLAWPAPPPMEGGPRRSGSNGRQLKQLWAGVNAGVKGEKYGQSAKLEPYACLFRSATLEWNHPKMTALGQHFEIRNNSGPGKEAAASSQQRDIKVSSHFWKDPVFSFLHTEITAWPGPSGKWKSWDWNFVHSLQGFIETGQDGASQTPIVHGRPHAFYPIPVQSEHYLSDFQSNSTSFHVSESILEKLISCVINGKQPLDQQSWYKAPKFYCTPQLDGKRVVCIPGGERSGPAPATCLSPRAGRAGLATVPRVRSNATRRSLPVTTAGGASLKSDSGRDKGAPGLVYMTEDRARQA